MGHVRRPVILSLTSMRDEGLALLRANGELRFASSLDPEILHDEIRDADALVVRTAGTIDAPLMDAAPRLRVIGRHGVGYDQIDVDAATNRGIQVVYTPGANTESVAEHTIAFLIGLAKNFPQQMLALAEGRYNDRTKLVGHDLKGKTLGIIGFGRIGRRLSEIAHIGLGMRILYNDIVAAPLKVETHVAAHRVGLVELIGQSESVSLHVPLDRATHHMINRETIARMRPGALLVNTCRGPVVDERAVAEALDCGQLGGYAADVFEVEPPPSDHPLVGRTDCILTPHSAAQTMESLINMARGVAEDVIAVLHGELPRNPVNDPAEVAVNRRRRMPLPPGDSRVM
jgi:D-3-phosphoglycerate dehydrogenase